MRGSARIRGTFVFYVVASAVQCVLQIWSVDSDTLPECVDLMLVHTDVGSTAWQVRDVILKRTVMRRPTLNAAARSLRHRFLVASATSADRALEIMRTQAIDVALIDYQLGVNVPDGLTLLARIKASWPTVRCALHSAYAAVQLAVVAIKRGADYVASKDERIVDVIAALDGNRLRRPRPSLSIETMERELVRHTLAECGGNKSRAAQALGITRQALYKKLGRWNTPDE